jgi:hypothetical protein
MLNFCIVIRHLWVLKPRKVNEGRFDKAEKRGDKR